MAGCSTVDVQTAQSQQGGSRRSRSGRTSSADRRAELLSGWWPGVCGIDDGCVGSRGQHRAEVRDGSPCEPCRTSAPSGASSPASKAGEASGVLARPCPRSLALVLHTMLMAVRDAAPHLSQRRRSTGRWATAGDLGDSAALPPAPPIDQRIESERAECRATPRDRSRPTGSQTGTAGKGPGE